MTTTGYVAIVIFGLTYVLIVSERIHKTKAVLLGAVAMLLLKVIDQHAAFHGVHNVEGRPDILGIDWNTILLLIAMMTIASTIGRTGAFQWVAIKAAKLARGKPFGVIALLSIGTCILSAALDNVTTVVLIVPITILICETLKTDPVPFLIFVVFAAHTGGTATLIGDPPNIMIASHTGLTFVDFLKVTAPMCGIILLALLGVTWVFCRWRITVTDEQRAAVMAFDESRAITDPVLLRKSVIVGLLTLGGFSVHGALHLEPATIALAGAVLLMLLQRNDIERIFHGVEWSVIFFIIGLFIMVAGLVDTGVVGLLSAGLLKLTQGNTLVLTMSILVMSILVSGLMGNIALVTAMNALLGGLAVSMHPELSRSAALLAPDMMPVWWALSLGAGFGANVTLVAAAANITIAGIAERSNYPIGFVRFLKYSMPVTLLTIVLCAAYLWILFFLK